MTEAEIEAFYVSFDRCMRQAPQFFDLFYEDFMASSAEIRKKFQNTDLAHQKRALRVSLLLIIDAVVRRTHDYSFLEQTALLHGRSGANINPESYGLWLDSLIRTAAVCDPQFNAETESIWRNALHPAIAYIVSKY